MNRKPTSEEVKEFTKVHKWICKHPGTGELVTERTTFANFEWKYFEGMNPPFKRTFLGTEPASVAYERIKRYMELDYESKIELRTITPETTKN